MAETEHEDDEDRRAREEAMERLLLEQEQAEEAEEEEQPDAPLLVPEAPVEPAPPSPPRRSIPYTQASFAAAVAVVLYALRTRQQYYLAITYLTSSKWAYIVLGNALIASCVSTFRLVIHLYLKGLRPAEAEGLGDFFRWNVTETCLALTMFRQEITAKTAVMFLVLVLAKCLHYVAETRRGHYQMTQEAVLAVPDGRWMGWPAVQRQWFGIVCFLQTMLIVDVVAVAHCAHDLAQHGPSVSLFFGFEAAILFVAAVSNLLLAGLHFCDGMIHWAHEQSPVGTYWHGWAHSVLHAWKDHKATMTFAVEVQAQAAKFLFYILFFGIVMTYYGTPINLFREVYMSFQNLRQRLIAFAKYRRLMQGMNRFESLQTEQELEEAGKVCIICRDAMTLVDCKKLPGCGHVFHKSCLREWLIHQQTCPTCRGDITATEARVRAAAARQQQHEEQQQQQQDEEAEQQQQVEAEQNDETEAAVAPHTPPLQYPEAVTEPLVQRENTVSPIFKEDQEKKVDKKPTKPSAPATSSGAFPCLYRVSSLQGALVWNKVNSRWVTTRVVSTGTIVLCMSMEWMTRDDDDWSGMMLQIPDGWICEVDLERMSIQIPKQTSLKQKSSIAAL